MAGTRLAWVLLSALAVSCRVSQALSEDWQAYNEDISSISIGTSNLGTRLGPVLNYQFGTPLEAIQAANVYTGGNARMRKVVNSLLAGNPIKVAFIGGVATNGSAASRPGSNDFVALYISYLTNAFPKAKITAVRKSAGIAPSAVVASCPDSYLVPDADLMVLEMTANDYAGMDESIVSPNAPKAYEMVVRSILNAPKQPALILAQSMVAGSGNGTTPYYKTPESPHYAAISGYYNLPYLSMRNALWEGGKTSDNGLMTTTAVQTSDGSTPLDAGHQAISDMLVYYTQRTAQDLQLLPYGEYDTSSMTKDVPTATMLGGVENSARSILLNVTCDWIQKTRVSGNCPQNLADYCKLDYSSSPALLQSYDNAIGRTEVLQEGTTQQATSTGSGVNAALIGGIVGGVGGGLLLFVALAVCCIHSKRKAQRRQMKMTGAPAGPPSPTKFAPLHQGVPIKATSRAY